ncbi:MAG: LL-diaminopimelate aminotransferase, partial [Kiritimatiellae bacterium]|nr:LL-diaminopimelate aminotransferase [Kiritimatiellia bacterium]
MLHVNENYSKIKASYLFTEIAHRVSAHQAANPDAKIIRLGIGDVTEPLAPAVIEAMHKAVDDVAGRSTFYGYGPEQGYAFLRDKVAAIDFAERGVDIASDEIFISDGAKCDCGNIQELFGNDVKIAVGDPVYPVYVDTNVMAGRTGANENGR